MRTLSGAALTRAIGITTAALLASHEAHAQCTPHDGNGSPPTECCSIAGPDVIVGDIHNYRNYPTNTSSDPFDTGYDAFAFGTTSCNIGDQNLLWHDDTNEHPVIGQNLFKLKDGRFEQIGMSWLKHGFYALSYEECGCTCSETDGTELGVGCSDPYSATLNGEQANLGPRWQVNAHTGAFQFEPDNPPYSGATARRLRVAVADLEPSPPPPGTGVLYFVEGHYVTPDDAAAGNGNNNASYRPVSVWLHNGEYNAAIIGTTEREQAGIRAWQDTDPSVVETDIQVPGEGLFILAAQATDLGDGIWHYEYALQNLNSDRSGGSFSVPLIEGTEITNVGFHDVDYHSSDGIPDGVTPQDFDGTDWIASIDSTSVLWETAQSYLINQNANALRWGTLYNFRFDADAPPTTGEVTLGLFKPGTPGSVVASTIIPGDPCIADIAPPETNGNGVVDVDDMGVVFVEWDNPGGPGDVNGDGIVDVDDLGAVFTGWGPCP